MLVHEQEFPPNTPIPDSMQLFMMCEAMDWNHLPQAGGLYDQHPQLIEDFQTIFVCRAKKQAADRSKKTTD